MNIFIVWGLSDFLLLMGSMEKIPFIAGIRRGMLKMTHDVFDNSGKAHLRLGDTSCDGAVKIGIIFRLRLSIVAPCHMSQRFLQVTFNKEIFISKSHMIKLILRTPF